MDVNAAVTYLNQLGDDCDCHDTARELYAAAKQLTTKTLECERYREALATLIDSDAFVSHCHPEWPACIERARKALASNPAGDEGETK